MKKIRRVVAIVTLGAALFFGSGSIVPLRAQGTQESKSKQPSTSQTLSDEELAYLLWLFMMWLIWGAV